MANAAAFLEDAVLDHVLGVSEYSFPAQPYLALYTTSPSPPDGTGGIEVSGGSYARQAISFSAASGGAIANSVQIEFPTATGNWGTINGFAIFDAIAGNMLFYGDWDLPKIINVNDIFRLPVGNLVINAD